MGEAIAMASDTIRAAPALSARGIVKGFGARHVLEGADLEIAAGASMRFRFDYEQARRPVGSLSGGERTRLALLLLMQDGAKCLVLDEPTNHLGVDSIEALEDALEHYDGTVVAVSHDRYFLDRMADRIVHVADGGVRAYEGGWSANAPRLA